MEDPELTRSAIYAGMCAYTDEVRRISGKREKVNARAFKVAVDAYNACVADGLDGVEVIDDG